MAESVVIDTSVFYALASDTDEFHSRATELYANILDRDSELLTTSYVVSETAGLIQRRLGFPALNALFESVENVVRVHWINESDHNQAWDMMKQRQGSRLSLVDCTTIVLARTVGASIFAFDRDFLQEGMVVIA